MRFFDILINSWLLVRFSWCKEFMHKLMYQTTITPGWIWWTIIIITESRLTLVDAEITSYLDMSVADVMIKDELLYFFLKNRHRVSFKPRLCNWHNGILFSSKWCSQHLEWCLLWNTACMSGAGVYDVLQSSLGTFVLFTTNHSIRCYAIACGNSLYRYNRR